MSKLFGGGKSKTVKQSQVKDFKTSNINAGGITSSNVGGTVSVNSNAQRTSLFKSLSDTFANKSREIGDLKSQLKPGFGALTEARVGSIRDRSRAAIGDLNQTLTQRRLKGSSFGEDALARAKAEFAKEEGEAKAQSFLEELDATVNLINQESEAAASSFQSLIENMNFEASIGTQLATQATAVQSQIATYNASARTQAMQAEQQSRGSLFGTILGTGIKAFGISKGVSV